MNSLRLFLELFITSLGLSYFVYGRKQQHAMAFLSGLLLMIYPYFVPNFWLMLVIGGLLALVPFLIKLD